MISIPLFMRFFACGSDCQEWNWYHPRGRRKIVQPPPSSLLAAFSWRHSPAAARRRDASACGWRVDHATVRQGRLFHLNYLWRVPPDRNWHDLKTLDLRVVDGDKDDDDKEVLFWLCWSEATNAFQLIDPATGQPRGRAFVAGSNHVLWTESVVLDVRDSSSQGSGPTGSEVTLHLTLIFLEESEPHAPFTIEVTAVDDAGQTQPFLVLGSVAVRPLRWR